MSLASLSSEAFPKAHRLLKRRDFLFRPYKRFQTESFNFIYTSKGQGRLGVSISKKVLRRAVARNRIRRLLREVFRTRRELVGQFDIHVIGLGSLSDAWKQKSAVDVAREFDAFLAQAVSK